MPVLVDWVLEARGACSMSGRFWRSCSRVSLTRDVTLETRTGTVASLRKAATSFAVAVELVDISLDRGGAAVAQVRVGIAECAHRASGCGRPKFATAIRVKWLKSYMRSVRHHRMVRSGRCGLREFSSSVSAIFIVYVCCFAAIGST